MACDAFADTLWCMNGCCVHGALVLPEQPLQVGACSWQAVPQAWGVQRSGVQKLCGFINKHTRSGRVAFGR